MSPIVWLVIWGVAIATLAFFTVREIRRGKKPIPDFDKLSHEAHREASIRRDGSGPNSTTPLGGF
ncbi:hypothetical protein [Marmoricola sp. URHB0036]|jgi:hypothetical protein|uniref:hypothetical protein n=1 Tax=Marmoricola sp. URHB0036 TaxID=1298863 RepID=UPI00041F9DFD|nr:hypothetical protein [Marmoricola sp. URHB0036]